MNGFAISLHLPGEDRDVVDAIARGLSKQFACEVRVTPLSDWTAKDGRSNSSDQFVLLSEKVASLIRGDAHKLLSGRADDTGRLVMAQLAHEHGLAPSP